MVLTAATAPIAIGPAPKARSMKALNVPSAAPRSLTGARLTVNDASAGVVNATPRPSSSVPASSPPTVGMSPIRPSPAAVTSSALPESLRAPMRSGSSDADQPCHDHRAAEGEQEQPAPSRPSGPTAYGGSRVK